MDDYAKDDGPGEVWIYVVLPWSFAAFTFVSGKLWS